MIKVQGRVKIDEVDQGILLDFEVDYPRMFLLTLRSDVGIPSRGTIGRQFQSKEIWIMGFGSGSGEDERGVNVGDGMRKRQLRLTRMRRSTRESW
jgi:hypothetical protein